MPAPVVAAATYFGLPRLLGALADKAMDSRSETLARRGLDSNSDALMRFLDLVPRQSGLESTLQALNTIEAFKNTSMSPFPGIEEKPAGYSVVRELPNDEIVFNTPMEDFLKYGGRDDDSGMSFLDLLRQDQSYGQTSQPASTVEFPTGPQMVPNLDYGPNAEQDQTDMFLVARDFPYGPEGKEVEFNTPMDDFLKFGGRDDDNRELEDISDLLISEPTPSNESSRQGGGGANGGLVDILRMMYAQRQR